MCHHFLGRTEPAVHMKTPFSPSSLILEYLTLSDAGVSATPPHDQPPVYFEAARVLQHQRRARRRRRRWRTDPDLVASW